MKKIFHFIKSNNVSGLENVVINICMMVKGYDYTVVSTSGPINNYLDHYDIKHIILKHLNPINMLKVIKKYHPNIVQAHDLKASLFLSLSYFYCRHHHIKMISQLHNNDPRLRYWWGLRSIAYAIASLAFYKVIIVSKDIEKNFVYRRLIRNKDITIKNVINPTRIKENLIDDASKKWDCIFLGRVTYQKNPLRFIKIIKILKSKNDNIQAIMVGSGDLLNASKHLVKQLHLENNISFVGFQANPYKYLQRSKILVMTSRYEGIPLVVLEALLLGDPVVSTHLYGLKGILDSTCGGFASNNKDFVNKIYTILTNKKLYNEKKRNAIHKMNSINNTSNFINSYKDVYK